MTAMIIAQGGVQGPAQGGGNKGDDVTLLLGPRCLRAGP